MALSKWFLCGAEERLTRTEPCVYVYRKGCSERVGERRGYYKEVGVGGSKDIDAAQMWYQLVSRTLATARKLG